MRIAFLPTKNGAIDEYPAYDTNDFPYEKLDAKKMKCNRRKGKRICQTFATFDIETTTIGDKLNGFTGFMYHWQMCVSGLVCYGRYWIDWITFISKLLEVLEVTENDSFVIFIHNAGYEFAFMVDYLEREFGKCKVFASQKRKPIKVNFDNGLEFRCSYKLSNMSLNKATLNEKGVNHIKAVGDLDYKLCRTPKTQLNDEEFGYCIADVVSLYEFIQNKLLNEHDNLETMPITSTGYVRRDFRRAARNDPNYRDLFKKLTITVDVYTLLKEAGRGGDTHGNRKMTGKELHNLDSYDVSSSYPYQLVTGLFPMTKFSPYGEITSKDQLENLINTKACLFRLTLVNPTLKDKYAFPYLPLSKCRYVKEKTALIDNGRILYAEYLQITVTDIDYKIITDQYSYSDMYVSDMHIAEYAYLPECLVQVVRDYFVLKSELKVKIKELEDKADAVGLTEAENEDYVNYCYLYAKLKNLLNGCFGMMYQDIVREEILYNEDGWKTEKKLTREEIEEAIEKYYNNRQSFLYYAWGVWTTARARYHLFTLINDGAGQENSAYCDTDSDKCIHTEEAEKRIKALNEDIKKICIDRHAYADVTGSDGKMKRFYMGVYEKENKHPIKAFKTLGAKRYAYVDDKDELHVTVSGVNKALGAKELKSLNNFEEGFTFYDAGGMELYYNDNVGIHDITVNGDTFSTASNIGMVEGTYRIGSVIDDYEGFLERFMI